MPDVDKRACEACYPHPAHAIGECEYCICGEIDFDLFLRYAKPMIEHGKRSRARTDALIEWGKRQLKKETTMMTFGMAIEAMREGKKVSREGWNGPGQWLGIMLPENSEMDQPYIFIFTVQQTTVPWLASQSDMLSTDWGVVEG